MGVRQVPKRSTPRNINEYIAASPPESQPILRKIRQVIRETAPQAQETISYRMPALRQRRILVYFAAFKKHIGLYPPVRGDAKLMRDVAPYAGPKGNLQFPLERRIPYALIRRIVKTRLMEQKHSTARPGGSSGLLRREPQSERHEGRTQQPLKPRGN
jgi:uncharacterized protein YdhG (YjbR/CyaY superfamily)